MLNQKQDLSHDHDHKKKDGALHAKTKTPGRKLRKSCSLETCHQKPGECMHCTCDGRCGQHPTGKCGVRREGSGKNCKRPDCPRDDTCLHSTRATCCHCRNLVSSHSRSVRAKRAAQCNSDKQIQKKGVKRQCIVSRSNSSQDDDETTTSEKVGTFSCCSEDRCSLDQQKNVPTFSEDVEECGLSELPAWKSREKSCNLIVIVEGVQFNLHKFPMLLQCHTLKKRLDNMKIDNSVTIPVIEIQSFPGGAGAFEMACIYCYTNKIQFSNRNIAQLYCAANFLGIDRGGETSLVFKTSEAFRTNIINGTKYDIVEFLQNIMRIHSRCSRQWMDKLILPCVNRLAMEYPFDQKLMVAIQSLPCELFLRITQMVLARKSNMSNVVAKLCAQAHLAEMFKSRSTSSSKAASLIQTLNDIVTMDPHSSELIRKVVREIGLEYGNLMQPKQRSTGRILAQAITQALTVN